MDQDSGSMEENFRLTKVRRFWGLRPWKRHSLILTVGGFLYVVIGILYIRAPSSPGREIALKVVLQIAPIQVWGGVFLLSGILSMLSSCWPPSSEKWGYMVLTGMSSGWATTHLLGVLFFGSPSVVLTQVLLWGILAFMWWGISGLSNPDVVVVVETHE
jgi:hypothetical protein